MALSPWPVGTPLLANGSVTPVWQRWFSALVVAVNGLLGGTLSGAGSPAGVIAADVGTLYRRTDGGAGTSLYVKEADAGLTSGWVAK